MAEASSSDVPAKPDENPPSSFRVKTISYGRKIVTVCMQNENGPCPLLAICNVLLLRGEMFIHPDIAFITLDELTAQLTACILKSGPAELASEGEKRNFEANVAASIVDIPTLARGLDVNVRYTGVYGFEFTSALAIFDLVRVPLCHGWLPDPTSPESELIHTGSYNQLVEQVINSQVVLEKMNATDVPSAQESSIMEASSSAPSASSSAPVEPYVPSEDELLEVTRGQMIGKWLDDTASQLTFYGMTKLYEELKEGQLAVFFRNNHFSTILMQEASLWVLLTDQGFAKQAAVWEKLDSVDGSSFFVTSEFTPFQGTAVDYLALPDVSDLSGQGSASIPGYTDPQVDLDAQLAAQLQEAEERKAKKERLTQSDRPRGAPKAAGQPAGDAQQRRLNQSTPSRGHPKAGAPAPAAARKRSNSDGKKKDEDCCIL